MDRRMDGRRGKERRWRIGELATLAGTSARAIRLYHAEGLLPEPERSRGGYRLYESSALASLIRIRRLRSLGFGIEQTRGLVAASEPAGLHEALGLLSVHLRERINQLRSAVELIDRIRTDEVREREPYSTLASKLRNALESGVEADLDAPEIAPLRQRIGLLEKDARWPLLQERLTSLRDSPIAAGDLEKLAEDLAAVLPWGLLPDQLADPVIPTLLLGARFSQQQLEVLHRAAELQREDRRRR